MSGRDVPVTELFDELRKANLRAVTAEAKLEACTHVVCFYPPEGGVIMHGPYDRAEALAVRDHLNRESPGHAYFLPFTPFAALSTSGEVKP